MKKIWAAIALTLTMASSLLALDVKEGRVKLVLYEDSGRFNLYWMQDVARERYIPLLFERDPRTSALIVLVDNRMYRMGESSDFRISVRKLEDGAEFVFRSSFLVVTQSFRFIRSSGATLADGVMMKVSAENVSEKDSLVGIRLILDSWLGERSGNHFITSLRSKVSTETRIDSTSQDLWLASPQADTADGLMMMTLPDEPLSPDSFIMANWSRLDSSPWLYDNNPTRSFTLQPYSINDSAIMVAWDERTIPRSGKREAVLLMGNRNSGGFVMDSGSSPMAELFNSAVLTGADASSIQAAVQMDLLVVRDLLDKINKKIEAGLEVSADELSVIKQILDSLGARKAAYQD